MLLTYFPLQTKEKKSEVNRLMSNRSILCQGSISFYCQYFFLNKHVTTLSLFFLFLFWHGRKEMLWKAPTLPHIKTFIWQCTHNSIGVKECLARRSVTEDMVCPCHICRREDESILHALRDCPWAQAMWRQLGVQPSNHNFWMSNLHDWLDMNGRMNTNHLAGKPPWKVTFPFAIWNI